MKHLILLIVAVLAPVFMNEPSYAASEGVRSRCYRCGLNYCFSYSYRTVAPRVILRRWRSQIGIWRSRYVQVPSTGGRWTAWLYGGRSLSGYAYMEHHLMVDPSSPTRIASARCSHY